MADKIQLTLENMIPELEQYVKLGIFQRKEIKKIIKKRRFYEYQFERKDVSVNDFFKAIKYEKVLDRRRINIKKQNNIKKIGYIDFHFLRRIVYLFKKCLAKFKKDKKIWMEFFNFLIKHKCSNILNKEIGSCLAHHSNDLDFWKIAAYNEHENNLNTFVARNIFQKCLRMNKDNMNAYLEYFIFEIKFVEKILERRKILSLANDEKNKLKMINDVNDEEVKKEVIEINAEESDDVMNLKICEIIWRKAISTITIQNKIDMTLKFLEILYQYKTKFQGNIKNLKNLLVEYIFSDANQIEIYHNFVYTNHADKKSSSMKECEITIKIDVFLAKLEKYFHSDNKDSLINNLKSYFKNSFEKLKKFNKINFNESCVSCKNILYMVSRLIKNCNSKIELALLEDENNNKNEIKAQLYNHLLNNTLNYFDENFENQLNLLDVIYDDNYLYIIRFTVENYDPKISFFDRFLQKTFDNILSEKIFSEENEKKQIKLKEYFHLFWQFNSFVKGKLNDEICEEIMNKIYDAKTNKRLMKNIIKLIIEHFFEESKFFSERLTEYIKKMIDFTKKIKLNDLSILKDIFQYMIQLIYKHIFDKVPKDIIYDFEKYMSDEIDKNYIDSLKLIETQTRQFLINFKSITNEIFNMNKLKFSHNEKTIYNLINK